jgi:cyclopropane fatty-acyl-phospholipid synthase-like methyltransferase
MLIEEREYRKSVGKENQYDILGALQFNLLTKLGLRGFHKLLDIGCGPLRAGRLFIQYLNSENYYGIEPNKWMIQQAIEREMGIDILKLKIPHFNYNEDFNLKVFKNTKFDFILAHSIFSHTSKQQLIKCFKQIPSILNKKGKFVFTYFKGNENNKRNDYIYFKGVKFKEDFVRKILKENGLSYKNMNIKSPNRQTYIKAERI